MIGEVLQVRRLVMNYTITVVAAQSRSGVNFGFAGLT